MFEDLDLALLKVQPFDGIAKFQPPYKAPQPPEQPEAREGLTIYNGSCHCGAVTYTLQTEPFDRVKRCDCSICKRVSARRTTISLQMSFLDLWISTLPALTFFYLPPLRFRSDFVPCHKPIKSESYSHPTQNNYAWLYPLKSALQIHESSDSALSKYLFGPKRSGHMFCSTCGVSMFNFVQQDEVPLRPVNARTINGVNVDELPDDNREVIIKRKDGGFLVTFKDPEANIEQ